MNDVIDNELTKGGLPDLPTVLKWIFVGVLGAGVFHILKAFLRMLINDFLGFGGMSGADTSYFLSKVISLLLTLIIFNVVIKSFKKRYCKNEIHIQKTIRQLIISYLIILSLQIIYPFIKDYFAFYHYPDTPDHLSNFDFWISIFYTVEIFIKYGFVAWILLKKD